MGKLIRDFSWILGMALVCGLIGGIVTVLRPLELASNSRSSFAQNFSKISISEFQKLMQHKQTLILDARAHDFFRLGHVPSAKNVSREKFAEDWAKVMKQVPDLAQRQMVVYCSGIDCDDSFQVAEKLASLGLTHVLIFEGGWEEWEAARLPKESDE